MKLIHILGEKYIHESSTIFLFVFGFEGLFVCLFSGRERVYFSEQLSGYTSLLKEVSQELKQGPRGRN